MKFEEIAERRHELLEIHAELIERLDATLTLGSIPGMARLPHWRLIYSP